MEIELKYNIVSRAQMDMIWDDADLRDIEEPDSRAVIQMKAAYFDTADHVLSDHFIAFRIRKEGNRVVGTLKWGDDDDVAVSGLYVREELNVPIKDDTCFLAPDPAIFRQSEEGGKLLELINGRPLVCIFETNFKRRKLRVDNGETICEVSLDEGEILAGDQTMPISELEIELYSGSQDDMMELGVLLTKKYELKPENRSKYARGRFLAEAEKNIAIGVVK